MKKGKKLNQAQIEVLTQMRKQGPIQTTKLSSEQKPVNFGLFGELETKDQTKLNF
jgi:hypothetical protein